MAVTLNPFTGELQLINAGGGGGGSISGSGASGQITYWDGTSVIAGNAAFQIDAVNLVMKLGGLEMTTLGSTVITDNQITPAVLLSMPHASYKHAVIDYSIVRGTNLRTGQIVLTTDGSDAVIADYLSELPATTGVSVNADVSGANVRVTYTSTATGVPGTFKYHVRRWA